MEHQSTRLKLHMKKMGGELGGESTGTIGLHLLWWGLSSRKRKINEQERELSLIKSSFYLAL